MTAQGGSRARALCFGLCAIALVGLATPALAQEILYYYDSLNRLVGVVDEQGNVAEYVYDAVGNILQVKRRNVDPSANVSITFITPNRGNPGTTVQIFGKGFSPTPGQNTVTFSGGAAATVTAATGTSLTTTVPAGATTGPIAVSTPLGSAVSPEPFTVLQGFAVVPDQADVAPGASLGFLATLDGVPESGVTWRVNGLVGGNATLGTITPAGLYTAPGTLASMPPVVVEAVRTADPTWIATATVRVADQVGGLIAATPLTVGLAAALPSQAAAGPVTVAVAQATGAQALAGPVTIGVTGAQGAQALAGPVTVGVTPLGAPAASGPLAVTGGPLIGSVAPSASAVGATGLAVMLAGANLQGASAVRFLRNGSVDTALTVGSITPAGDGASVSFSLTISGAAATGARVLQVVTPQGTSTNFDLGTNVFTVTP